MAIPVTSPPVTAALTLSLSGPYQRQGTEAAHGVRLWAQDAGVRLDLVDDGGSRDSAAGSYARWVETKDLLLGPYASGLVRAVAPIVRGAGRLLWNHGGSADDLAQPAVVAIAAPASSYFHGCVDEAIARRCDRVVVVQGRGPFARAVTDGALAQATERGLGGRVVDLGSLDEGDYAGAAVLAAGNFEHDLAVVRQLGSRRCIPRLLCAVAAGISAFGRELGEAADGVFGPVQWWPTELPPDVGPSGSDFAASYRRRMGHEPSYPAAQAAAAGYLADAALRRGLTPDDVRRWATSTLLGDFALSNEWAQVGHRVTTICWEAGRMVRISPPAQ